MRKGDGALILESLLKQMLESEVYFETAVALLLVYYIALTVAQYKLFQKAGEKGWKALIPIYSVFVSHHLIGMRHIWFILDLIFWGIEILLEVFHNTPPWVEETFFSVAIVVTIISEILHIIRLCYCYTKSELFGIGMFLCPPLFSLILAFSKDEYHPPLKHREHQKKTPPANNT